MVDLRNPMYRITRRNFNHLYAVDASCSGDISAVVQTIRDLEKFTLTDDEARMCVDIARTADRLSIGTLNQDLYYNVRFGMLAERNRWTAAAEEMLGRRTVERLLTEIGIKNSPATGGADDSTSDNSDDAPSNICTYEVRLQRSESEDDSHGILLDNLTREDWIALINIAFKSTNPPVALINSAGINSDTEECN